MENKVHTITEKDSKNILGMIISLLSVLLLFGILAIHNNILTVSFISVIVLMSIWTMRKELIYLWILSSKVTKILIVIIIILTIILLFLYRKKIKNILSDTLKEHYYTLFQPYKPYPNQEDTDEN
jgi:hypothetical protein